MPRRKAKIDTSLPQPTQVAEVAAVTSEVASDDLARLKLQFADLEKKLQASEEKRGDAEQRALDLARSQGALMQRDIEAVPTGKKVKVERLDHYDTVGYENNRPVRKPVFKTVEVPTYFYKVDLPPCGGIDIKTNGISYYHGVVYEFTDDVLRDVRERVYRCWQHDAAIHGSDENFYRKPKMQRLSARA